VQAGVRLPERGQDSIWVNGLCLSKGGYNFISKDGKVKESFSKLPSTVLLVERAALIEHLISELNRLEPSRYPQSLHHFIQHIQIDSAINCTPPPPPAFAHEILKPSLLS
jgi:hypothetical protein